MPTKADSDAAILLASNANDVRVPERVEEALQLIMRRVSDAVAREGENAVAWLATEKILELADTVPRGELKTIARTMARLDWSWLMAIRFNLIHPELGVLMLDMAWVKDHILAVHGRVRAALSLTVTRT